jgi:TRAP-type transport system periplasmic protein
MMRPLLSLAAAALLGVVSLVPAHARDLRVISGWPVNYPWTVDILEAFLDDVKEKTGGELSFTVSGPDTVPTFEQLQPTQAGAFDVLFTHPSYHAGTTSLGIAIDAARADPQKRREIGYLDALADVYRATQGVELVAAPPIGSVGFRVFLRQPIDAEPGLKGKAIRGTASHQSLIRELGGSPVNMPGGEIYTSLQRGVIDGAIWATTGIIDFKLNEVSSYFSEPAFGQVGTLIFFNAATWKSFTDEQRAVIEEAARAIELSSVARYDKQAGVELEQLKKLGMTETPFQGADAGRLDRLWAESVWQAASQSDAETVKKLRELALQHDLTY